VVVARTSTQSNAVAGASADSWIDISTVGSAHSSVNNAV